MFGVSFDRAFGLGVVVFALPFKEDDSSRYEAFLHQSASSVGPDQSAALIMISDAGYPPPNAVWRKRILDAAAGFKGRPLFALVTSSRAVALASTALAWLRPLPYERTTVTRFEDAVAWMEEKRGGKLAKIFEDLRAEARRQLSPSAVPPSRRSGAPS